MSLKSTPDQKILSRIYAAAAEPELWPKTITHVADRVGAIGGMLTFCAPPGQQSFNISGRLDEDANGLFLERHLWNPFSQAMLKVPNRRPVVMSGVTDIPAVRRTEFWADIMAPQGIQDNVQWKEPSLVRHGAIGGFGFCLGKRAAERAGEVVRQLTPLMPHLSRSLDISLSLGKYANSARQLTRILQLMPGPAMLLDGNGCVAHANPAAEELLRGGDGLTVTRNSGLHLTASLPAEARALSRSVLASLSVAAGEETMLTEPLRLTRPSGRAPLIVLLAPLPRPAFALWQATDTARVLLLIADRQTSPQGAVDTMRVAFWLTLAESRVAELISNGLSAPQAAEKLGLALTTVKTHLSHCFDKTGTRSQIELVRLLSILPPDTSAQLYSYTERIEVSGFASRHFIGV